MRPVLHLPPSPIVIALWAIALLGLIVSVVDLARMWHTVPERTAIHFGADGKPDRYGSKLVYLLLPGLTMVVVGGMVAASRYPWALNYPWTITEQNAERLYRLSTVFLAILGTEMIWLVAYVMRGTLRVAAGERQAAFGPLLIALVFAVLFATIVAYIAIGSSLA